MRNPRILMILAIAVVSMLLVSQFYPQSRKKNEQEKTMSDVKIITLDPGHFHAALVQKEMYPGVSPVVNIYAPLGFDLTEHLNRIARFNLRKESPTKWQLEIHTG